MNNLSNAMSPYAAVVGIPPAEMREVKATWLGRIVQRSAAPKMYMTVTAFRGCLCSSTLPIQEERGRTPSRATAKMRREAATIATLVLWHKALSIVGGRGVIRRNGIHQNQTQHCDDGHENTRSFPQGHGVDLDERLGGIQGKESIQIRGAKQEEDGGNESHDSGGDSAGQDTTTGNDAVVLCQKVVRKSWIGFNVPGVTGFLCNVTRSIETDHRSGCE